MGPGQDASFEIENIQFPRQKFFGKNSASKTNRTIGNDLLIGELFWSSPPGRLKFCLGNSAWDPGDTLFFLGSNIDENHIGTA